VSTRPGGDKIYQVPPPIFQNGGVRTAPTKNKTYEVPIFQNGGVQPSRLPSDRVTGG
jgi:hypothetical protein